MVFLIFCHTQHVSYSEVSVIAKREKLRLQGALSALLVARGSQLEETCLKWGGATTVYFRERID